MPSNCSFVCDFSCRHQVTFRLRRKLLILCVIRWVLKWTYLFLHCYMLPDLLQDKCCILPLRIGLNYSNRRGTNQAARGASLGGEWGLWSYCSKKNSKFLLEMVPFVRVLTAFSLLAQVVPVVAVSGQNNSSARGWELCKINWWLTNSLVAIIHSSHKASYSNFDFDTVLTLLLGL